uniref:Uncharacterized protein n=1 Tax=Rhizophora mucronata TaxID=61149 RepID=A0A2P2NFL9_RHIMU
MIAKLRLNKEIREYYTKKG